MSLFITNYIIKTVVMKVSLQKSRMLLVMCDIQNMNIYHDINDDDVI